MNNTKFNNSTKLLISVSNNPTNFGVTIYNHIFDKLKMNFIYLPFKISNPNDVIEIITKLDIYGCSVSSPLKETICNKLKDFDEPVKRLGNINTIKNNSGTLKGYNTDYYGIKSLVLNTKYPNVLIYGYGAGTKTIVNCLSDIGIKNIRITGRDNKKIKLFCEKNNIKNFQNNENFDLLINATPSGNKNDQVINYLDFCSNLIDLNVSNSNNYLVKLAVEKGLEVSKGTDMSILQLQKQFEIYFGFEPDKQLVIEGLEKYNNLYS